MPTITGTEGPVEQPERRVWSRSASWQTVRTWQGTKDAIEGLLASLTGDAGAESLSISGDGPIRTLEATFGNTQDTAQSEQPSNLWELLGNDIELDVKTHPYFFNAVSSAEMQWIEKELEDRKGSHATKPAAGSDPAVPATVQGAQLFDLLRAGTTSYVKSQYVFRHSVQFSSRFNYAADVSGAFDGVENIWTTAQMYAFHPDIPATLRASVNLIVAPPAKANFLFGWLKKTGTISEVAGGRYQHSQEWWLEQWSTIIYPPR